jgi:hypothetical protein
MISGLGRAAQRQAPTYLRVKYLTKARRWDPFVFGVHGGPAAGSWPAAPPVISSIDLRVVLIADARSVGTPAITDEGARHGDGIGAVSCWPFALLLFLSATSSLRRNAHQSKTAKDRPVASRIHHSRSGLRRF